MAGDPHKRHVLNDIPFPALRELIGGALPLERGLTDAIARSQSILAALQSSPVLTLQLETGEVRLGPFSFHLSRQLLAVYAFFLIAFNSNEGECAMAELFAKRLLLAQLERCIDRSYHVAISAFAILDREGRPWRPPGQ